MKALAFALALLGWMGTAANAASVNLSFNIIGSPSIGAPVVAAKNNGTTNTLAPTVDIPAGMLVLVTATPAVGNGSLTSISDGINTYTLADGSTDRYATKLSFCSNCAHIPSGTVLTASGTDTAPQVMSIEFNGGLDQHLKWNNSTAGKSFSETTPTLSTPPGVVYGAWQAYGTITGYTEGAGFDTLTIDDNVTAPVGTSYQIPTVTNAVTWAPPPPPSSGTTYYITPNGSDGADGKTVATAWHSPKHNINCADNIIVQPGNYTGVPIRRWSMGDVTKLSRDRRSPLCHPEMRRYAYPGLQRRRQRGERTRCQRIRNRYGLLGDYRRSAPAHKRPHRTHSRTHGSVRAAHGHLGGSSGHQQLSRRSSAGICDHAGEGCAAL
jgi:hypothetical protein